MWKWRKIKLRRKRTSSVTKHYVEHKESARELVLTRLAHYNQHYGLCWNRVAIRNQRRCWGSCSSKKNLNFNYKIQFLPPHLQDYIIVHEMCHLVELNHGANFWKLVAEKMPDYITHVSELRAIDKAGHSILFLNKVREDYLSGAKGQREPVASDETSLEQWCESCSSNEVCNCGTSTS